MLLLESKEIEEQKQKKIEVQPKAKEILPTQGEIVDVEPSTIIRSNGAKSLDKEKSP